MSTIFLLQWQRVKRAPLLLLSMIGFTVVFVFLIAGMGPGERIHLHVYTESSMSEEQQQQWIDRLNESQIYAFALKNEDEAKQSVASGQVPLAVKLMEQDYRIVAAAEDAHLHVVDRYLQQLYAEELRLQLTEQHLAETDKTSFRTEVMYLLEQPALTLTTSSGSEENGVPYNSQHQALFGMTLFFVIFTISFGLSSIVEEKRTGTCDRMILSPVKKLEMYIGYLTFCFTLGYVQIVCILLFFQRFFGFDLGESTATILIIAACYTFAIVALGMLLLGIVRNPEQLQAVIPIVAVSFAMIGGAQWPLEAVSNEFMLTLSKFVPVTYGMEALKGAATLNKGVLDLAEPLAILLCYGVILMGIGINLLERKRA